MSNDLEGASEPVRKGMSLLEKRRLQDKISHLFRKKKYQAMKEGEEVSQDLEGEAKNSSARKLSDLSFKRLQGLEKGSGVCHGLPSAK